MTMDPDRQIAEGQRQAPRDGGRRAATEQGKPPPGVRPYGRNPGGGFRVYGPLRPPNKGRYRVSKIWYGQRELIALGFTPPRADTNGFQFSFNFPAMHDGDTVLRTLFGWYAESVVEGDASGLEKMMTPGFVGLAYFPDPGGDVEGSAQAPGGAQLYRDTLGWQSRLYTNGSIYGVKYWAGSQTMRSSNVGRIVQDKTTAFLEATMSLRQPDDPDGMVGTLVPDVNAMLWVEILVDHH